MTPTYTTYVQKSCAYVTRRDRELLVFEGPEHDGLQVPKGTIEPDETPREALRREVMEESGLDVRGSIRYLTTDVWTRRRSPPRKYVRHFFRARVDESRDSWTHVVAGDGTERGLEYEFSWVDFPTDRSFALALDDYLHLLVDGRVRSDAAFARRGAGFAPRDTAIAPGDDASIPLGTSSAPRDSPAFRIDDGERRSPEYIPIDSANPSNDSQFDPENSYSP